MMRERKFKRLMAGILILAMVFCCHENLGPSSAKTAKSGKTDTVRKSGRGDAEAKAYQKTPKETMYLKGVKETLNKAGKTYNLYDIDQDGTEELFVGSKESGKRTVKVFLYDKKSHSAKRGGTYKKVTKLYEKSSKKSVIVVQKKGSKPSYIRLQIKNKKLVSTPVKKKACKKAEELILRTNSPWVASQVYGVADLTKRPDERSDFYLATNYDYLTGDHIRDTGDASSHWTDGEKRTTGNLKELFTDRNKLLTLDGWREKDNRESQGAFYRQKQIHL